MKARIRERLGKTYDRGSRHNIYDANSIQAGVRMPRILKRQIEKWCEENKMEFAAAVRQALSEKWGNVLLSNEDYAQIEEDRRRQEARNACKMGL